MKNMYIRIHRPDGAVRVSVPLRTPKRVIQRFVEEHMDWILMKQEAMKEDIVEQPKQYTNGEIHYVWGQPYTLNVMVNTGRPGVAMTDGKLIMKVPQDMTSEQREKIMDKWYRIQMQKVMEPMLRECEDIVGKSALEYRIKNMKTKWGTCNVNARRIWLNLRLAKMPQECLRYVIIHELTHLYVRGHNMQFRAYLDEFCPGWRNIENSMK